MVIGFQRVAIFDEIPIQFECEILQGICKKVDQSLAKFMTHQKEEEFKDKWAYKNVKKRRGTSERSVKSYTKFVQQVPPPTPAE